MDANITEYSDSDSGDSWTILDATTECGPEFPTDSNERLPLVCNENDEDTDGISIISSCHHDSPTPDNNLHESYLTEEDIMSGKQIPTHFPLTQHFGNYEEDINFNKAEGSDKDYLIEGNGKLKTYVHRRNKRLSTVLNIIMLGSVITATGVAIGHMWGAKNDCTMHHTPSVNKILSNLYKLQEENAYLRTKLKELTLLCNLQTQQHKMPVKNLRCKKVFEEPLENSNTNKLTKCIDRNLEYDKDLESHLIEPSYEKELVSEINHLKTVYKHNKNWLDKEIDKRIKYEKQHAKNPESYAIVSDINKTNSHKSAIPETTKLSLDKENDVELPHQISFSETEDNKKISYADSLKSDHKKLNIQKWEVDNKWKSESDKIKKNVKKNYEPNVEETLSDEEIKKDDRYNCHKCKYNKKKTDKWRKKQKRRDKYEQFDIKDLVEDYDDTENIDKGETNEHSKGNAVKGKSKTNESRTNNNNYNKSNWFEKRSLLRKEHRKRLEQELFGEKTVDDSSWYFRRMKKREQCRAKAKNETNKKPSKLNMNFKIKY